MEYLGAPSASSIFSIVQTYPWLYVQVFLYELQRQPGSFFCYSKDYGGKQFI